MPFTPGRTPIPVSGKVIGDEEIEAGCRAVRAGRWTSGGVETPAFERELAQFVGVRSALMVNSGSSANLAAVSALTSPELGDRRLRPGDEVITCGLAFPTTVAPLVQNGLVPVFIDCEPCTYQLDARQLEKARSRKTKAVVAAHTLGNPCDLEAVGEFCRRYGYWLIEDNCDALGSLWRGRRTGSFGHLSTLSFYPAHHMTCGEGGAVLTDDPKLARIVESFVSWGKHCFPQGTPVNVNERVVPIEQVRVGDQVLTHEGRFRRVTELTARPYTGAIQTIKARLRPPVKATAEHPFWVFRTPCAQWVQASDLAAGDYLIEMPPVETSATPFRWSYKVNNGKRVVSKELAPEPGLMRLIGYWLAEGSLANSKKGRSGYKGNIYECYRADFAFHAAEAEYIADVRSLMLLYFGVKCAVRSRGRNGCALNFKSRSAYEFFKQFFGAGSANKRLPPDMLGWPLGLLSELVLGYWSGDGSETENERIKKCDIHSVSQTLLEQVRRILIRADVLCSSWCRPPERHTSSVIGTQVVKAKHTLHAVSIYGRHLTNFRSWLGLSPQPERAATQIRKDRLGAIVIGGVAHYPVVSNTAELGEEMVVFNLEVEQDHSYHAGGVAVHNCWCAPGCDNTCGKRFEWELGQMPKGWDHKYLFSHLGYNLKATDIQAAIAREQLKRVPGFTEARRRNFQRLYDQLADLVDLILPVATKGSEPSWFGFPICLVQGDCRALVAHLESKLVATRPVFAGDLTRQPCMAGVDYRKANRLPVAQKVMESAFWVGVWPGLTDEMVDYAAAAVRSALRP